MEPLASIAEEIPALDRDVLDALMELERAGNRRAAIRLRDQAMAAYARCWDAGTQRRLGRIRSAIDLEWKASVTAVQAPRSLWPRRRHVEEAAAR